MIGDRHIVNQLEPHPYIPVIATCGIEKNIKLWAPSSNDFLPLPPNVQEIMESNRQAREDHSRIMVTPDVIMHALRLHRRQSLTYIQRRYNTADVEGDEEDEFITAFRGMSLLRVEIPESAALARVFCFHQ